MYPYPFPSLSSAGFFRHPLPNPSPLVGAGRAALANQVPRNKRKVSFGHPGIVTLAGIKKAGDGNRTHVSSLEGWCSTIELHLHDIMKLSAHCRTPIFRKCPEPESNQRHEDFQSSALPTELSGPVTSILAPQQCYFIFKTGNCQVLFFKRCFRRGALGTVRTFYWEKNAKQMPHCLLWGICFVFAPP